MTFCYKTIPIWMWSTELEPIEYHAVVRDAPTSCTQPTIIIAIQFSYVCIFKALKGYKENPQRPYIRVWSWWWWWWCAGSYDIAVKAAAQGILGSCDTLTCASVTYTYMTVAIFSIPIYTPIRRLQQVSDVHASCVGFL